MPAIHAPSGQFAPSRVQFVASDVIVGFHGRTLTLSDRSVRPATVATNTRIQSLIHPRQSTNSKESYMQLSVESKIISGILLILVPTIMYGGVTLLGILTDGGVGHKPGQLVLDETQRSLWRAGHAHAGVFVMLALILQPLVDQTALPSSLRWVARLGAPFASILVPAAFFGLAFVPAFKWILYLGIALLAASMLLAGVGLLRNLNSTIK